VKWSGSILHVSTTGRLEAPHTLCSAIIYNVYFPLFQRAIFQHKGGIPCKPTHRSREIKFSNSYKIPDSTKHISWKQKKKKTRSNLHLNPANHGSTHDAGYNCVATLTTSAILWHVKDRVFVMKVAASTAACNNSSRDSPVNRVTMAWAGEYGVRICRSHWPRGSAADRLLGLRVRIPPGIRMFVLCVQYSTHKRNKQEQKSRVKWVPVTTAWRVLRLRKEERPPDTEGSCEYIE
jgi:hypothetical protein